MNTHVVKTYDTWHFIYLERIKTSAQHFSIRHMFDSKLRQWQPNLIVVSGLWWEHWAQIASMPVSEYFYYSKLMRELCDFYNYHRIRTKFAWNSLRDLTISFHMDTWCRMEKLKSFHVVATEITSWDFIWDFFFHLMRARSPSIHL